MASRDSSYAAIGTSTPIFVPSAFTSDPVRVGVDYFSIRVYAAQVSFVGSIWSKVRAVLVSTQVNLHHQLLGEKGLRSLQQARAVNPSVDEQLGLAVNLVDLTPAVMSQVSLSVDFHLDKENRLTKLAALVNKDSFSAVLSLAPGSVAIAKTVSALAEDIVQTFLPAEEQEPILQFTGDFNLSTNELTPGYYVVLGSRDADNPIPSPLPRLEVKDQRVYAGGQPLSGLSYVVIEVRKTSARSRDLGVGTQWDDRLREAEDIAQGLLDDPLADDEARKSAWEKCRTLIREAQTFLRAEPSYLRAEAEQIVKAAFLRCRELAMQPVLERSYRGKRDNDASSWVPDERADRQLLAIGADEDLEREVQAYAEEVVKARQALAGW
ncbi:hypothetical protein [Roseateles sp. P5_E4]